MKTSIKGVGEQNKQSDKRLLCTCGFVIKKRKIQQKLACWRSTNLVKRKEIEIER